MGFLKKGADVFDQKEIVADYEKKSLAWNRCLEKRSGDRVVNKFLRCTTHGLVVPHKMSTAEKVELVAEVKDRHGLNKSLQALELPKSTWYYWRDEKPTYATKFEHLRVALTMGTHRGNKFPGNVLNMAIDGEPKP